MGFYPKSQLKKLQPGIDLLQGNFGGFEALMSKAMNKLFRKALKLDDKKSDPKNQTEYKGFPTPADVTLLQTRNLQVIAMKTSDYLAGNFQNTITLSNEIPTEEEKEPIILRHYSRPYLPDYEKGYYDRYIFFDIRNKEILEVSERDYLKYRELRYKRATVISWYILGQADDYQLEGYIYPGVINNNIDVCAQAESQTPGISEFFKLYKGFDEHLLEDISQYDGAVEIIEPLEDPPDLPTDDEIEEEEDLSLGDQLTELPPPPNMDLVEDLEGSLLSASAALDGVDETIDEVVAEQDAITAELEDDLADQESRLQSLEEEQERQQRLNDLRQVIDVDEMNLSQDIINMSSKAKRKKKRKRLDQERDEKKIILIAGIVFDASKYDQVFTGEEFVIAANSSSLKARLKLILVKQGPGKQLIKAVWSRNNFDSAPYNSSKDAKNGVYTVTGEHARLYSDPPRSNSSSDSSVNYDSVTLTEEQRSAALGVLTQRERNQVPALRTVVINYMKDEVIAAEESAGNFRITRARNNVTNRYQQYKRDNGGNTEWSKRGGDRGGDFTRDGDGSQRDSTFRGGPVEDGGRSTRDKRTGRTVGADNSRGGNGTTGKGSSATRANPQRGKRAPTPSKLGEPKGPFTKGS